MNPSYFILMILISYSDGQSLTSSESVVEKPGKSVTLSCSVSALWTLLIQIQSGLYGTFLAVPVISDISDNTSTALSDELQQEDDSVLLCINDTGFIFIWTVSDLL
ncbi:hypothetical protein SRHO_G00190800 [Serrasalmus rhombeus]